MLEQGASPPSRTTPAKAACEDHGDIAQRGVSTSELRHQRARVRLPKKQLRMQLVKIELCEGSFKSVRRDYCRNKHPKEMTSDELLVKLKRDNEHQRSDHS